MIKLLVVARCIPEDVYLQSLDAPQRSILAGEKRFQIVVRDPEEWFIGRLAIEIKNRYENLYKRDFGQVKYLKDADDDCDLDPGLTVADLLVDEGKAAKDGADQKRVVKVIQEGGRALRQGSVIPDLTPAIFQPPSRPPVPLFSGAEKRSIGDSSSGGPNKRVRLDQIEEEAEAGIVPSIEGQPHSRNDALNGAEGRQNASIDIKHESPEAARVWVNTAPATRDELQVLPDQPSDWASRSSKSHTTLQQHHDTGHQTFDRRASLQSTQTPGRTSATEHARTPGYQSVALLNGMSLGEPITKSASKYRGRGDPYEFEESDIDDSQMSPQSRASRMNITPKLVSTSRGTPAKPSSLSRPKISSTNNRSASVSKSASLPTPGSHRGPQKSPTQLNNQLKRPRNDSPSITSGSSSKASADKKQKPNQGPTTSASSSRSSSMTSNKTHSGGSKSDRGSYLTPTSARSGSGSSRQDSASAQLEENLRRSSPMKPPTLKNLPQASATVQKAQKQTPSRDVARLPDSVSNGEDDPPLKVPKRPRTQRKSVTTPSNLAPSTDEKCYRCWTKHNICDNLQPKCTPCQKESRNCQYYRMTQHEALREQEDRRAKKTKPPRESMIHPDSKAAQSMKDLHDDEDASSTSGEDYDEDDEGTSSTKPEKGPAGDGQDSASDVDSDTDKDEVLVEATTTATNEVSGTGSSDEQSEEDESDEESESDSEASHESRSNKIAVDSTSTSSGTRSSRTDHKNTPTMADQLQSIMIVPNSQLNDKDENPIERAMQSKAPGKGHVLPKSTVVKKILSVTAVGDDDRDKSPTVIIPSWMTQEDYDKMLAERATMTEEERKAQKLEARKRQMLAEARNRSKDKKSTISPPATDTPIQAPVASLQPSSSKASSASVEPSSGKAAPASSNAAVVPQTPKKTTPVLTKSSPITAPATVVASVSPATSRAEARQQTHPNIATSAKSHTSKTHTNPPFRPPRTNAANIALIPATIPTIDRAKSVKDLRDALRSQNASGASTPQPRVTSVKTKKFSIMGDQEDEGSSSSGSDDSGHESDEKHPKQLPQVRKREVSPSSDGSGSGSDSE